MELMWVRVFDSCTDCFIDYTPTLHVGLVLIEHQIKSRHGVWNTLVLGLQWFTFKTKEITNKVNILLLYFLPEVRLTGYVSLYIEIFSMGKNEGNA